jgi:hypothetical protein
MGGASSKVNRFQRHMDSNVLRAGRVVLLSIFFMAVVKFIRSPAISKYIMRRITA